MRQQIIAGARRRGLDPLAVLAVAQQEGLSGRVGDAGTSFGPFQLHVGGAFPRGVGGNRQAWAMSPAGLNYALDRIASVARGKRGQAAINAIVRSFERPANPGLEVSRALASYGKIGGGAAGVPLAPRPTGLTAAPGNPQMVQQLISELSQHRPDVAAISGLLAQGSPPPLPNPSQGLSGAPVAIQKPILGKVALRPGADRAGVHTSRATILFVRKIAGLAGMPLTIGTGTQHSQMTVNGRVSDHWSGHAADIPAVGPNLVHLGRVALIAAGANPRWANKQTGGLYNINGHQIIFNTHIGGDHTNHLHVSAYK